MKIVTWNVNGIRAVLGKGALEQVWELSPDVLCLQEVKARPEQVTEGQTGQLKLPFVWNPAERAGYSGVATLYKDQPLDVQMGLGEAKFDTEGRVIATLHPGFRLFNIYFPNGQRGQDRVDFKL
jgi:exodeoxyribonuclease-3